MRVSVIIPVFNDAQRLRLCLDAIRKQTFPGEDFEVLVIDNGSEESMQPVVDEFPSYQLHLESKPGSYSARNEGLRLAKGELLAFTDADCLPSQEWLASAVAALDADPSRDIVGGDILIFPAEEGCPNAVELYDIAFGLPQEKNIRAHGRCMTANLITRRNVFERVGDFDEHIFGGADHLWCNRVVEQGGRVDFVREALVRHPARRRLADLLRQARRAIGGRIDRRAREPHRGSIWRKLYLVARMYLPNIAKAFRARSELAKRGYGVASWLRVIPVVFIVQYTMAWEAIRVKLFRRKTERS